MSCPHQDGGQGCHCSHTTTWHEVNIFIIIITVVVVVFAAMIIINTTTIIKMSKGIWCCDRPDSNRSQLRRRPLPRQSLGRRSGIVDILIEVLKNNLLLIFTKSDYVIPRWDGECGYFINAWTAMIFINSKDERTVLLLTDDLRNN